MALTALFICFRTSMSMPEPVPPLTEQMTFMVVLAGMPGILPLPNSYFESGAIGAPIALSDMLMRSFISFWL